jgi:hypothetical protein
MIKYRTYTKVGMTIAVKCDRCGATLAPEDWLAAEVVHWDRDIGERADMEMLGADPAGQPEDEDNQVECGACIGNHDAPEYPDGWGPPSEEGVAVIERITADFQEVKSIIKTCEEERHAAMARAPLSKWKNINLPPDYSLHRPGGEIIRPDEVESYVEQGETIDMRHHGNLVGNIRPRMIITRLEHLSKLLNEIRNKYNDAQARRRLLFGWSRRG